MDERKVGEYPLSKFGKAYMVFLQDDDLMVAEVEWG